MKPSITMSDAVFAGAFSACVLWYVLDLSVRTALWSWLLIGFGFFWLGWFIPSIRKGKRSFGKCCMEFCSVMLGFIVCGLLFYTVGRISERFLFAPASYFEVTILYGMLVSVVIGSTLMAITLVIRCLFIHMEEKRLHGCQK